MSSICTVKCIFPASLLLPSALLTQLPSWTQTHPHGRRLNHLSRRSVQSVEGFSMGQEEAKPPRSIAVSIPARTQPRAPSTSQPLAATRPGWQQQHTRESSGLPQLARTHRPRQLLGIFPMFVKEKIIINKWLFNTYSASLWRLFWLNWNVSPICLLGLRSQPQGEPALAPVPCAPGGLV